VLPPPRTPEEESPETPPKYEAGPTVSARGPESDRRIPDPPTVRFPLRKPKFKATRPEETEATEPRDKEETGEGEPK
jgi:arabinofuranan 3-O-arabinosyltransferase